MPESLQAPTIEDFLNHFVEGYLFGDLQTMATSGPDDDRKPGHLGYSMALVCCSGIELLGSLVDDGQFDRHHGSRYFAAYWEAFLYPTNADLGPSVYRLIRHGLAHSFFTRRNVLVSKGNPNAHLTFADGAFHFDVTALAADLERSYRCSFKPALKMDRAQARLNERLSQWTEESEDWKRLRAARRAPIRSGPLNFGIPVSGHPSWPPQRVTASGFDTIHTVAVNSPAPGRKDPNDEGH